MKSDFAPQKYDFVYIVFKSLGLFVYIHINNHIQIYLAFHSFMIMLLYQGVINYYLPYWIFEQTR